MGFLISFKNNMKFESCLSVEDLTSMVFQFGYYKDEAGDSFQNCQDLKHLVNRRGFTERTGVFVSGAEDPAVNGFYAYETSTMGYRYRSEDGKHSIVFSRGSWKIQGTDYWVFGNEASVPVSGWKSWIPNGQFAESSLSIRPVS